MAVAIQLETNRKEHKRKHTDKQRVLTNHLGLLYITKTIKSAASEEIVLFAIEALSEALEHGVIKTPGD